MENIDCERLVIEETEFSKGAFSKVYKGSYFGNPVCVKVIKKESIIENDMEIFLEREIQVLKNLFNQPHNCIIRFIGIGEKDSLLFIVTELVNGGDLGNVLYDRSFNLPWKLKIKIAKDISDGMKYLHEKQIMHRDLKSSNLLIGKNWNIKICDFGFAKFVNNPLSMTICGTDEFMSPEVILGIQYSYSADVYSFGMVLIELITRNRLEERLPQNNFDIDYEELQNLIPSDCPRDFYELALKCCSYYPKDRPTFNEIYDILDKMGEKLSTIVESTPTTPQVIKNPLFDESCIDNWFMLSLIPDDCLENINEDFTSINNNNNSNNKNNIKNNDDNNSSNSNTNNNDNSLKESCENCEIREIDESFKKAKSNNWRACSIS
ncbi:hypothetical protein CYY_002091 [Polysphondylium violaceum]|uniref:non-specific serine/threonine protein kinase n=1 Tax=Polysphondylium violaceum TaxID=133409 RepID=A0A8J4V124_9MYCE|nr:hypothetical protein CYY_002091 [Polysphondylium violaceum]